MTTVLMSHVSLVNSNCFGLAVMLPCVCLESFDISLLIHLTPPFVYLEENFHCLFSFHCFFIFPFLFP